MKTLIVLIFVGSALAQGPMGGNGPGPSASYVVPTTATVSPDTRPTNPATGRVIVVTDSSDCSTHLTSAISMCRYNGASWDLVSGGGIPRPGNRVPAFWEEDGAITTFAAAIGLGITGAGTTAIQAATTTTLAALRFSTSASAGTSAYAASSKNFRYGKNLYGRMVSAMVQTGAGRNWLGFTNFQGSTWAGTDTPTSSDLAAFRYSASVPDTNFMCVTENGSAGTYTDSGIVADTTQHIFEISVGASSVVFKIDGTVVCTNTTTLPRTTTLTAIGQVINNIATASVMGTDLVSVYVEQDK